MKAILLIPPILMPRFLPARLSLVCTLFLPVVVHSQQEVFYGSLQRQELLAATPIFEVSDDFDFSDSVEQTQSVRDVIWFSIDEDTLVKSSAFTHWVRVTIEKYDETNTLIGTETNVQFRASYDPAEGVRYNNGQVYEFTGVHRFKVTVTSKSSSFLGCFRLEGKIIINRDYNFNCSAAPALLTKTHAELYDAATNALRAGWHTMPGAEEYDLEWAFYDTLGATIDLAADSHDNFDFMFRNNATRITTPHTWYNIPLVYPQGRIYWRVRGVRYKDHQRQQSRWTSLRASADTLVLGKEWYWVNGHETGLNWQMQTVFAEEGKKSQSATYFDGSMRNRQQVVRSDAIDMVIASETIYDSLGRAGIQVMPAPVSYDTFETSWTRAIQYIDTYSTAPGKSSYSAVDFHFTADSCQAATWNPAAKMDSTSSAVARYYSSANPWKKKFMAKFTPASGGYPFAVTEYTADPTGRVRRQGGVGPAFQLGSEHETQYFYGKPDQDELDRLFGNEAGYAAHYQKNTVIDPNGQASVSYIDAHGRTIATALAGAKPANLEQLPNFSAAARIKKDLLNNVADDLALVSTYSLFVGSVAPDTFLYSFGPPLQLSIDSCLEVARCYDCKYDVQITVVDQCGQEWIDSTWNNYPNLDLSCDTLPDTLAQMLVATLPVGMYQVTKTLRLSETALNYYADDFIAHLTCIPDPDSLKRFFLGDTICAASCAECYDRLGSRGDFLDAWIEDIPVPVLQDSTDADNAYSIALQACSELCDNSDPTDCGVMYELMLLDVSPGGQYANYGEDYVGPDSLFIYIASLDTTSVFFKFPADTLYPYQDVDNIGLYLDEFGNVDYITLPDSVPIRVDSLSINEFITWFKPSWAQTLVKAHPEYCAWLCCKNSTDPYFDSLFTSTTTYAQALANGFLPLDSLMAKDSLFATFPDLFGHFDTLWNMYTTTHPTLCSQPISLTEILKSIVYCGGQLPCDVEIDTLCTADNDLYWELIKSHYESERSRLKRDKIRGGACPAPPDSLDYCKPYDELCFGQPTCGGLPNPYRDKTSRLFSAPAPMSLAVTEDSIQILIQYVHDQLENACDTTCAGMADAWILQLAESCDTIAEADSSHLAELRARFIAVCKSGCDLEHSFGVVETPGDTTEFGDYNLLDVITGVFPGLDTCTMGCRPELIGFPGTFDVPQYTAPAVQIHYFDTCRCDRLDIMEDCWQATYDTLTFLAFINGFSNVQLTEAQLDKLQSGCDTTCTFMDEAIAIPPILECNTCKTLAQLEPAWEEWIDSDCIGGTVQADEEAVVAGYLNRQFGLNRSYEDYYAFIVAGPQDNAGCRYLCPLALFPPETIDTSCVSAEWDEGLDALAHLTYQNLLDSMRGVFVRNYLAKCLGPELVEHFTVSLMQGEYHYTLYFYDQADNLARTVPPKGITPLTSTADLLDVKEHRADPDNPAYPPKYPAHNFNTRYWYNTLNQVIRDSTPDRGDTDYWYDRLGRIVLSQNAKQQPDVCYTYSLYDALGRVVETGKVCKEPADSAALNTVWDYDDFSTWLAAGVVSKTEITKTFYDEAIPTFAHTLAPYFPNDDGSNGQTNLRNRIASVTFDEWDDGLDSIFAYATHYSYDIAGNVKQLVQDMPELATVGHRFKRIGYNYDLVSGKVNYVYYQKDSVDQFIHHYVYDEDNRVEFVRTSRDGLLWERDANYEYYLHGPLGRTELGERRVQGLDYAYTLQGWLKGMNASALCLDDPTVANFVTRDMGRDGKRGNTGELARNKLVARDVAAFTLGYYYGDYRHTGTVAADAFEMSAGTASGFHLASPDLYNGNIRHTMYTIARLHQVSGNPEPEGYTYKYDQLNRLVAQRSQADHTLGSTYAWDTGTSGYRQNFREDVTYDPNGNILTYRRGGGNSADLLMDNLTYHYGSGDNKLLYIDDAQTNTTAYPDDLEDQSSGNYDYDPIGNVVYDGGMEYTWTNAQKLESVAILSDLSLTFKYDAMQNRVAKYENGFGWHKYQYYFRDAQGNVMATYKLWKHSSGGVTYLDSVKLMEQHIYGSARVGMVTPEQMLYPTVPVNPHALDSCHYRIFEGWKRYEITNHLGNVLAVITDRKRGQGSSGDIEWFAADVLAAQQYYPFGMLMPGDTSANVRRQYSLNTYDYRYGFNGKEGDDEVKGDDNQQDYGMRIYDPRVARFLSVDPIAREYPMLTPYQFASNTPIQAVDLDGLEAGVLQQHQMSSEEAWANLNVFGDFLLGVAEAIMAPFNAVSNDHAAGNMRMSARKAEARGDKEAAKEANKRADELMSEATEQYKESAANAIMGTTLAGTVKVVKRAVSRPKLTIPLSRHDRLIKFYKALEKANAPSNPDEAIGLINKTLDDIEDAYSGVKKNPNAASMPDQNDGRMYGILDEKYVTKNKDGTVLAKTRGHDINIQQDGSFQISDRKTGEVFVNKAGKKIKN